MVSWRTCFSASFLPFFMRYPKVCLGLCSVLLFVRCVAVVVVVFWVVHEPGIGLLVTSTQQPYSFGSWPLRPERMSLFFLF